MRKLFLIVVFWGTIPLFYVDPFYGVVHYTLINIIRPEQLMWGDRSATGRIFMAVQANTFFSWLINKDAPKLTPEDTPVPLQWKLMFVVALGMTLSGFTALTPSWSWYWTTAFYKTTLFCFVLTKSINTAKKVERYYAVSLVWLMLLQMWGIQQKLGGNERMEGLGGDQLSDVNGLASIAVMYFPMSYYSLYSTKKWIKLFIGVPTTIISVIFILFGGSRGAFLGLVACMLFIFWRSPGLQKIKMILTFIIVGTLLAVVLSQLAPEGFFDEYTARLSTIFGEEDEITGEVEHEGSAAGRTAMWKGAFHLFRQHPEFWLTGVGMAGYQRMYFRYIDDIEPYVTPEEFQHILFGGRGGKALHNTFISVFTGGGLVTFLPWISLVFYAWYQAHNIPKRYPKIVNGVNLHNYALAIEVGIIGRLVTIMFLNQEFIDFFYWYMMMGGIIANISRAKLKREESGQEDEEFDEEFSRSLVYSH